MDKQEITPEQMGAWQYKIVLQAAETMLVCDYAGYDFDKDVGATESYIAGAKASFAEDGIDWDAMIIKWYVPKVIKALARQAEKQVFDACETFCPMGPWNHMVGEEDFS